MKPRLPSPVQRLWKSYPAVWKDFEKLGEACHDAGPLDERTRRIVNAAIGRSPAFRGAKR